MNIETHTPPRTLGTAGSTLWMPVTQLSRDPSPFLLRFNVIVSMYHMSWDYHVIMTSLVPDYSTTFHTTSHSDSYYYRD
jgi:hypothetical protein